MDTVTAELELLRGWLTRTAKALCRINGVYAWEDLAQEGWIAMWKAHARFNGSGDLTMWLKANARWRMKTVMIRRRDDMAVTFDDIDADSTWHIDSGDVVEDVMNAYHEGEIRAAIDTLSPAQKKYVLLRFYGGLTHAELEKEFGYNPGSLWSSKKNGARWKLAEELERLNA